MWRCFYEGMEGLEGASFSVEADAQSLACMGEKVRQRFVGAGYLPYYLYRQKGMVGNLENVGYCRPGAQCLYNMVMIAENQHVVGLGAGAASKILMGAQGHKNLYHPKDIASYGRVFRERAAQRAQLWRLQQKPPGYNSCPESL
jgi:oxygen-independent coproporphyrinogen-3 oxidase